jgi:RNA polymerase sigma-70 factor (ECF subfamily)
MVAMSQMSCQDSYAEVPHPEFIAPWTQTAEEILQQVEIQEELEKALLELDDKYRLVFVLRDIEGLSVRQAAEALELTEATVKVRLLRARLALRERLTRKFGDVSRAMSPNHRHS